MANLAPSPKFQAFDTNGDPLSGGKLFTYLSGTSTPATTYTDAGGGTANANPVILDSRGEADVWLPVDVAYRYTLKTAADVLIWTVDGIYGSLTTGGLQNNTTNWVVAGGTADAITATYAPAITTLADGQLLFFRATAANETTTPSFSPNSLTARTITLKGGAAVHVGAIPAALAEVILRYNLANTRWELVNPAATAATGKTTPVDADELPLVDSAASNILKKLTWANLKATLVATANSWTAQQTFKEVTETVFTITDAAGFEIDPANGTIQLVTLGANRTPAATNFAAGQSITLMVNDGSAFTITWTTVGVVWVGGSAPTLPTSGYGVIVLWKVGSTIYGTSVGNVA